MKEGTLDMAGQFSIMASGRRNRVLETHLAQQDRRKVG